MWHITTKPIEQVKQGETVLARNEQTGKTEYKKVLSTSVRQADAVLMLEMAATQSGQTVETITATREHPFYVEGKGFTPAGGLAIGNSIVTRAGPALIVKDVQWQRRQEGYTVYNFEVEDDHTYFVGKANGGVWVHNYPPPPDYRSTFFSRHPNLNPSDFTVHHAVEQQVQDLYPGKFTYNEIHDYENLRGIPNEINGWTHLSAIRTAWNEFYRTHPNATRQEILDFVAEIDRRWGGNFVPYR